jgi:copper chaperone CopZ
MHKSAATGGGPCRRNTIKLRSKIPVLRVRGRAEVRSVSMDPADPHNLHDTADKPVWERIDIATAGNDCVECVRALREPLMKIEGVKEVIADPKTENVWITFDARKTHAPELHDAILRSGYKPAPTVE